MPIGRERDPQRQLELSLLMRQQTVFNRGRHISDFYRPIKFSDSEPHLDQEIRELSDRVTDLLQSRLDNGQTLYVYDGSHATRYRMQQEISGQTKRLVIDEHKQLGGKGEIHEFTDPIFAAQFSVADSGRTGLEIITHDGSEIVISSEGSMRPNGFWILGEKLGKEGDRLVDITHELLVGRADSMGSLDMGLAYRGGTMWVISGQNSKSERG